MESLLPGEKRIATRKHSVPQKHLPGRDESGFAMSENKLKLCVLCPDPTNDLGNSYTKKVAVDDRVFQKRNPALNSVATPQ